MIIFSTFGELTQRVKNSVSSWRLIFEDARVVLFGEYLSRQVGQQIEYRNVSTKAGLPLISDMFNQVYSFRHAGPFLFINSDIIVTQSLRAAVGVLEMVHSQSRQGYLAVGQRTEIASSSGTLVGETDDWESLIRKENPKEHLLPACGADWFLFNQYAFYNVNIPPFVVARTAYDNWLIFDAIKRGVQVVNCTGSVTVFHQRHPEQKVRQSEEAKENLRLAKESHPDWDEWHGWINQAPITLEELREEWNI